MRRAFRLYPTCPTGACRWAALEAPYLLGAPHVPTLPSGTHVYARRVYTRACVHARLHTLIILPFKWGGGEQSVGMRGVALPNLKSW